LKIVRAEYDEFVRTMEQTRAPLPVNEPAHGRDLDLVKRKLDCAVL
jgi:hypothetical protein